MGFISKKLSHTGDPIGENADLVDNLQKNGVKPIKLIMGDPARYFKIQDNVIKAYQTAVAEGKNFYLEGQGLEELREAVTERYSRMYNVDFDKNNVIITQGVVEALQFLNHTLIYGGDPAILVAPFFTQYIPSITLHEGVPLLAHYNESKDWDLDIDDIKQTLKKAKQKPKYLLITNPSNPTGTVSSEKSLKEVVEFAKDNDLFLVADEVYDEIVYNGAKFVSLSKLAKGIPHMIFNGASKNYLATGFRVGFSIIPENDPKSRALLEAFVKLSYSRLSANTPSQYAMLEGLRNTAEHAKAMSYFVPQIAKRSNTAAKLVNETEYLTTVQPNSAFYIFPRINFDLLTIKDDTTFVRELLKEVHVQLTRGSNFGMPGYIRIVTLPDESSLTDAIGRIERFCKAHSK